MAVLGVDGQTVTKRGTTEFDRPKMYLNKSQRGTKQGETA